MINTQTTEPDGLHMITGALINEMRRAQTWSRLVECADALVHVRLIADSLEREAKMFRDAPDAAQSTVSKHWQKINGDVPRI